MSRRRYPSGVRGAVIQQRVLPASDNIDLVRNAARIHACCQPSAPRLQCVQQLPVRIVGPEVHRTGTVASELQSAAATTASSPRAPYRIDVLTEPTGGSLFWFPFPTTPKDGHWASRSPRSDLATGHCCSLWWSFLRTDADTDVVLVPAAAFAKPGASPCAHVYVASKSYHVSFVQKQSGGLAQA